MKTQPETRARSTKEAGKRALNLWVSKANQARSIHRIFTPFVHREGNCRREIADGADMWTASTIMTRRPSADDPTCSADAFTTPAESLAAPTAGMSMEDEVAEDAMGVGDTSAVRTINRGAFSTVTLVLERMSGRYCALKATRKAGLLRAGAALSVVREKQALLALQPHPFVVQLFWTAQDTDHLYMLLQLGLGGDLRGVLLRRRRSSYGPALAEEQVHDAVHHTAHCMAHDMVCGAHSASRSASHSAPHSASHSASHGAHHSPRMTRCSARRK